jgi:hypothetical protein
MTEDNPFKPVINVDFLSVFSYLKSLEWVNQPDKPKL